MTFALIAIGFGGFLLMVGGLAICAALANGVQSRREAARKARCADAAERLSVTLDHSIPTDNQ